MTTAVFTPFKYLGTWIKKPFESLINQRSGPFSGTVVLDSSRVYILPTRVGMIFTLLLIFLLLGSINYTKSLGFMLTFLLASLGIVGMLMTWRNLAGLRVSGLGSAPVYAGQTARFLIQMENLSADNRYALKVVSPTTEEESVDIVPGSLSSLTYHQQSTTRGYLDPGRIRIETEFPLGLFVAWTWVNLSMRCLVYPLPADKAPYVPSLSEQAGEEQADGVGLEDFAGLRKFQSGDSWRHISWKAAARLDELYSKEFTGGQPERQWIEWQNIDEPSLETRLSIMVRLVIDAQQAGRQYGLRLPTLDIEPSNGIDHQHRCLKALALYRLDQQP